MKLSTFLLPLDNRVFTPSSGFFKRLTALKRKSLWGIWTGG